MRSCIVVLLFVALGTLTQAECPGLVDIPDMVNDNTFNCARFYYGWGHDLGVRGCNGCPVADYYNIKTSELLSKRRNRSITRPRQIAMALSKELTNHSLPEIGDAFGGRDHTTVIHACEKTKELTQESLEIEEDYKKLRRYLNFLELSAYREWTLELIKTLSFYLIN